MKIQSLLSAALLSVLAACQSAPQAINQNLPNSQLNNQLGQVRAQGNAQIASQNPILRYYPIEAGRTWTFELAQTQNDQNNTKYKTLNMQIEPLAPEGGAERAVLRRGYPDAPVTPTPSLIKRYVDRVELSRYQDPAQPATQATGMTEHLSLSLPAGARLPYEANQAARGKNFIIAMQLPFQAGEAWEGRQFQGGTETIRFKGEEIVTVPAGTFKAQLVEHHLRYDNGREDFLRYWYAPGVGMVKLYEELTAYFGQWLKMRSTGVLTKYSVPTKK